MQRVKQSLLAPDQALFFNRKVPMFFLFLHENICCGYSLECLDEVLLMSIYNINFHGEIWKILCEYPMEPLSFAAKKSIIMTIMVNFLFLTYQFEWQHEKTLDMCAHAAKIQISIHIRAESESSLGKFWIAKDVVSSSGQLSWRSDCMDAQADLSLH